MPDRTTPFADKGEKDWGKQEVKELCGKLAMKNRLFRTHAYIYECETAGWEIGSRWPRASKPKPALTFFVDVDRLWRTNFEEKVA